MTIGNFFIWADLDGMDEVLEGGPKGEDGGFTLVIHQRNQGGVITPIRISGESVDGQLDLKVSLNGEPIGNFTTLR